MKKIYHHKEIFQKLFFFYVFFSLILISNKGFSQCPNADFSMGDFSNWTGSTGLNSGGDYNNEVIGFNQGVTNSPPTDAGQQTIINVPGTDPNTGNALSILPPGGSSCARLGNENTNYGAERMEYTLNVTSSNCVFTYQYAVVFEDPSHPLSDQPKFTIFVLNATDSILDSTIISAQASIPGFHDATHAADGETTRWKDWTTVWVDMSSYIGQNITIQFTTYDCAQGAHFGYAYIACSCGNGLQLVQQCQGNSVVICAPSLYTYYLWSNGDTSVSTTIINPVYGDSISCTCVNASNDTIVIDTVITIQTISNLTTNAPVICNGDTAVITASGNYSYSWNNGLTGQSINVSPTTTTVYTVTAINSSGCSTSASAIVTVSPGFTPDICMVTVDTSTNYNLIVWEKPMTAAINQYYIYRESSISGIYNIIGSQNYSDFSTFLDTTSNSIQQPYRYELAIFDTCSILSQQSSYHQTVHLTVNAGTGGSWNLIWNDYIGFSFSTYNIYRGSSSSNMTLLNSVASSITSYTDVTPPTGTLYYLIEAVNPSSCNPSLKSGNSFVSTISNIASTNSIGLNEFSDEGNIQVYPNPSNGILTIQFNELASIEILNSLGQLVFSETMSTTTKNIDTSAFSKGVYSLKLTAVGKSYFRKIVIE